MFMHLLVLELEALIGFLVCLFVADGHGSETLWEWDGCEAWNPSCQRQKHYTHLQPLQVPHQTQADTSDVFPPCLVFIFSPVYRASSTSPSSQSSKMNSMLYQKQFQPNSGSMRMSQHFPGQFNPQVE